MVQTDCISIRKKMSNSRTRQSKRFFQDRSNQWLIVITILTVLNYMNNYKNLTSNLVNHTTNTTIGKASTEIVSEYTSQEYMRDRSKYFYSWYEGNNTKKLLHNADINGTILDFIIAGFPKCGTTTMMANLGYIAPMPVSDVCTRVSQTTYYSYKNWPKEHQGNQTEEKLFRGSKCPMFLESNMVTELDNLLPRTKLIAGIRHPVLWFQSFWNMQRANNNRKYLHGDPYKFVTPCPNENGWGCRVSCPHKQLICASRARFHVALARLGRTDMSQKEIELLSPNDPDGGVNVKNLHIRNPIFLYEYEMLNEEYMWSRLGRFLGVNKPLQHDQRRAGGKNRSLAIDFCDDKFDDFRALLMPIAYNVSVWIQDYFIPIAKNKNQNDVIIPEPDTFWKLVDDYKHDPCGKLTMKDNGTFVLKSM